MKRKLKLTNFNLVVERGVPKKLEKYIKIMLFGLERTTPIRHRVCVLLSNRMSLDKTNAQAIKLRANEAAIFGLFCIPTNRATLESQGLWPDAKADCTIILATRLGLMAKKNKYLKNRDISPNAVITHHLFHEAVHYAQWRDKKKLTEVGVRQKADKLMDRFVKSVRVYGKVKK